MVLPLKAAAEKLIVAWPLPGAAVGLTGAPGTVAARTDRFGACAQAPLAPTLETAYSVWVDPSAAPAGMV